MVPEESRSLSSIKNFIMKNTFIQAIIKLLNKETFKTMVMNYQKENYAGLLLTNIIAYSQEAKVDYFAKAEGKVKQR